jgi:hypothetical protein
MNCFAWLLSLADSPKPEQAAKMMQASKMEANERIELLLDFIVGDAANFTRLIRFIDAPGGVL